MDDLLKNALWPGMHHGEIALHPMGKIADQDALIQVLYFPLQKCFKNLTVD